MLPWETGSDERAVYSPKSVSTNCSFGQSLATAQAGDGRPVILARFIKFGRQRPQGMGSPRRSGQRAASRCSRAQRSAAANQRSDLAGVWARIQRRRQYFSSRAVDAGFCLQRDTGCRLVAILHSSEVMGWGWFRAGSLPRDEWGAGAGASLAQYPEFPHPFLEFLRCWLTVMASHDGPRFKPMPNAWLCSL
jgi:hypothetical protein